MSAALPTVGQVAQAICDAGLASEASYIDEFWLPRSRIRYVMLPEEAEEGAVSWLRSDVELERFTGTMLLLSEHAQAPPVGREQFFLRCEDPRRAMSFVIRTYFAHLIGHGLVRVSPAASVHPTAVLGPHGQGFLRNEDGSLDRFPQIGGIKVEPRAEVGPLTTVMCAAIGYTKIEGGAKVGNGCNIGHGARIGPHALLSAHVTVGGGVQVGARAILWQNVCVAHGVRIGDDAVVGMGSVVLRDVPEGETWAGNPARPIGRGEGI